MSWIPKDEERFYFAEDGKMYEGIFREHCEKDRKRAKDGECLTLEEAVELMKKWDKEEKE